MRTILMIASLRVIALRMIDPVSNDQYTHPLFASIEYT